VTISILEQNVMRRVRSFALWFVIASAAGQAIATPAEPLPDPAAIAAAVPAPLYRDPVYDGAADPVVVWNAPRRVWAMFYT
jgi:hypothetical protein